MLSLTRNLILVSSLIITMVSEATVTLPPAAAASIEEKRVGGLASTPTLSKDTQIQSQQAQIDTLNAQAKDLKAQLATATKTQADVEAQLTTIQAAQQQLTTANATLTNQNQALTAQVAAQASSSASANTLNAQIATLTDQLNQTKAQLSESVAENASLRSTAKSSTSAPSAEDQAKIADLQAQIASLTSSNATLKQSAAKAASAQQTVAQQQQTIQQAHTLAQQQWSSLQAAIASHLQAPLASVSQAVQALPQLSQRLAKRLAGDRASMQTMVALKQQVASLTAQLGSNDSLSDQITNLTKDKADALTQLNAANAQLTTLQAQVASLSSQLASAQSAIQQLKTSPKSPAHLLQNKFILYQQTMNRGVVNLQQHLIAAGAALDSLNVHVQQSQALASQTDQFARTLVQFCDDLKDYFASVKGGALRAGGSSGSSKSIANLTEQIVSLTQQLKDLSTSANAQIAALQNQLMTQGSGSSSSSAAIQALQDKLDAQQQAAIQQQLTTQQIRDASLSAQVNLLGAAQTQNALAAQSNRTTDLSTLGGQIQGVQSIALQAGSFAGQAGAVAQQAYSSATQASAVSQQAFAAAQSSMSAAIASAMKSGGNYSFGTQPLSQLTAGMPQVQYAPTMQTAGAFTSLPMQGQQVMAGIMQLPQYSMPTSMGQAQGTLAYIVQNNQSYRQYYLQAIGLMQSCTNQTQLNNINTALQQAIKNEAYFLYQYGISGGASTAGTAQQLLQDLLNSISSPYQAVSQQKTQAGFSVIPDVPSLLNSLTSYIRQL